MGRLTAVRKRVALGAVVLLSAFLASGSAAGVGLAHNAYAAAVSGCKPQDDQVATLRLKAPIQTVRVAVGESIKVVVDLQGDQMRVPEALDDKQAVCRISWHRVSAGKVIATFLARRAARKITFRSYGQGSSKSCSPDSHGCPHPVDIIGYAKIRRAACACGYRSDAWVPEGDGQAETVVEASANRAS